MIRGLTWSTFQLREHPEIEVRFCVELKGAPPMSRRFAAIVLSFTALGAALPVAADQIVVDAPVQLTRIENAFPAWSPDGKRILFQSNRTGRWHLYVMNSDGSNVVDLTPGGEDCRNASFSPDGSRIVFYGNLNDNDDIFIMDADGRNVRRLTDAPGRDIHPYWSYDGTKILFNSQRDNQNSFEIYSMNPDGSGQTRITNTDEVETCAHLSPDGKRILLLKGFLNGNDDIVLLNPDGSGEINLSDTPYANEGWPSWSPDGKRILFSSNRTGIFAVYVMNVDGTELRRLTDTNGTVEDARAVFSPDGRKIAFTRRHGSSMDIHMMRVVGTSPAPEPDDTLEWTQ